MPEPAASLWTFAAHAGVRASITIGPKTGAGRAAVYPAYVADQQGYAYALDAASGRELWSRKVDAHPLVRLTGAPAVYGGRVFVPISSYEEGGKPPGYACCTFRGGVMALDARTGAVLWRAYTIAEPPALIRATPTGTEAWGPSGGGVWSAPTIDVKRKAIYVGVGNTYSGAPQPTTDSVIAFDMNTGKMRWSRQMNPGPRDVFGCVAGEINCAERPGPDFRFRRVAGARDAAERPPADRRGAEVRRRLCARSGQAGRRSLALPGRRRQRTRRRRVGHRGGRRAGVRAGGRNLQSGAGRTARARSRPARARGAAPPPPACGKPTRACSGAQFSAVTVTGGLVFSPSNDGAVRAHSTRDGSIVWSFDTNRDFKTINGVRAKADR